MLSKPLCLIRVQSTQPMSVELRVMVAQYQGGPELEEVWTDVVQRYRGRPFELRRDQFYYDPPDPAAGIARVTAGQAIMHIRSSPYSLRGKACVSVTIISAEPVRRVVRHVYLIMHVYGHPTSCRTISDIVLPDMTPLEPIMYLVAIIGRPKNTCMLQLQLPWRCARCKKCRSRTPCAIQHTVC